MSNMIRVTGINSAMMFSLPMLLFGFALKAALVPFHAWLPDAHPTAPAPVSAILSSTVIKALSLYGIGRIFFGVFGMTPVLYDILLYGGLISVFFGAFAALAQTDFKRMLAYSSISQIGYIMLGIGLGTPLGFIGGLFHLFNHATFKSLYFLCAGATEYSTGTRQFSELGGLSEKMPYTTWSSLFASFSLAGIPPFNGFWSKFIIVIAAIQADKIGIAILAVIASILTLGYFLKIQREVFFSKLPQSLNNIKEVPFLMVLSMVVLALICLGTGLGFSYIVNTIIQPAADVLVNGVNYGSLILTK
jgi:multicomponent Na+:H+ antiporter subunit D